MITLFFTDFEKFLSLALKINILLRIRVHGTVNAFFLATNFDRIFVENVFFSEFLFKGPSGQSRRASTVSVIIDTGMPK